MTAKLVVLTFLSAVLPPFENNEWKPQFTASHDVLLEASTVAILTHSSSHFDPLGETESAVTNVVRSMKQRRLPVLYFHDRNNELNPLYGYLYSDWNPTAYLKSDIGEFDLDFSHIEHVVTLGGFFGMCQRNTVIDSIGCWQRDGLCHDLRITFVLDGVFDVCEAAKSSDEYYKPLKAVFGSMRKEHPQAAISLDKIVRTIDDELHAREYLMRMLPGFPPGTIVDIDYFGRIERIKSQPNSDAPRLTIAYRRSDNFLNTTPDPLFDSQRRLQLLTRRLPEPGSQSIPSFTRYRRRQLETDDSPFQRLYVP